MTRQDSSSCDGHCAYRRLYEGSQSSLTSMASAQAAALNRVATLRNAIVLALKKTFPAQFNAAEQQLGTRMTGVDDEILLSYLQGMLAATALPQRKTRGVHELRESLSVAGYDLPDSEDLSEWAETVATHQPPPAPIGDSPDSTIPSPEYVTVSDSRGVENAPPPVPPFETPQPESHWGQEQGPADDLFSDGQLTSLFDDAETDPDDLVDSLFDDAETDPDDLVDSLFDDAETEPDDLASSLFGDDPAQQSSQPEHIDGETGPVTEPSPTPQPEAPTPGPSDEDPGPPTPQPGTQSSIWDGGQDTVRPTLFPKQNVPTGTKTHRRKQKRTPRVAAARPEPGDMDVPVSDDQPQVNLTDDIKNQLAAAVRAPRPVFLRDLAAQIGSAELIEAWKQQCFDNTKDSEVRFIFPKPRHKAGLGDLVLPYKGAATEESREFTDSWWAICLKKLRGRQLYEVAVLLHRFGDGVLSSRIDGNVVVLRVNNKRRGLTGVVVALGDDFDRDDDTRRQVAKATSELLTDHLALVAVLTTSGRKHSLEHLARAVREDAEAGSWPGSTPIVASRSWDFDTSSGQEAIAVR